jgi:hypothetical protein
LNIGITIDRPGVERPVAARVFVDFAAILVNLSLSMFRRSIPHPRAPVARFSNRMIPKSGYRFSDKIMRNQGAM